MAADPSVLDCRSGRHDRRRIPDRAAPNTPVSSHFYSTMNPNRNSRNSMKTKDRRTVDPTMKPGGIGAAFSGTGTPACAER